MMTQMRLSKRLSNVNIFSAKRICNLKKVPYPDSEKKSFSLSNFCSCTSRKEELSVLERKRSGKKRLCVGWPDFGLEVNIVGQIMQWRSSNRHQINNFVLMKLTYASKRIYKQITKLDKVEKVFWVCFAFQNLSNITFNQSCA
jgi:hypothetical protein